MALDKDLDAHPRSMSAVSLTTRARGGRERKKGVRKERRAPRAAVRPVQYCVYLMYGPGSLQLPCSASEV